MSVVRITEFLRTGAFGPITIGSTLDALEAAFGPTDDRGVFDGTTIVRFGWYEFFYDKDSLLYAVQNDHLLDDPIHHQDHQRHPARFRNDHFEVEPWLLAGSAPPSRARVERALGELGIAYVAERLYSEAPLEQLRVDASGVTLTFEERDRLDVLNGIRLFCL